MGAPVKFIKCTLVELQEREPDAKKVDIYMKDGKLFFIVKIEMKEILLKLQINLK